MESKIIDGKAIATKLRAELKEKTGILRKNGITPKLAVILAGDDPASHTYVRNKQRAASQAGIEFELFKYEEDVSEKTILAQIDQLNNDPQVHGILVQLPLPKQIQKEKVIMAIHPKKDVDGFHPMNTGKMLLGEDGFIPCTPLGILALLEETGVKIAGRHAVIVGRSNIVGKPMGQLLLNKDATVTYCHSKTRNLREYTSKADILVSAVGIAKFLSADDVKEGSTLVDVGMNRDENGKLCGDIDTAAVLPKAAHITPVPGGVGPMTITMLLANTIKAAENLSMKNE